MPPTSCTGKARTFCAAAKAARRSAGSQGVSTTLPSALIFQPWKMQHRPPCSLRPSSIEALRCGQASSMKPTRPSVARNATKFSPTRRTGCGAPSRSSAAERIAGIQYSRSISPIGVPGPTRVSNSFCSRVSMVVSSPMPRMLARNRRFGNCVLVRPEMREFGQHVAIECALERHDQRDELVVPNPPPRAEFGMVRGEVNVAVTPLKTHREPFLFLSDIAPAPQPAAQRAGQIVGQPVFGLGDDLGLVGAGL